MLADDVASAVQRLVKDNPNVKEIRVNVRKKKCIFMSVEFDYITPNSKSGDKGNDWGLYALLAIIAVLLFMAVFQIPGCLWKKVEYENTALTLTNRCSEAMLNMSMEMRKTKTTNKE